MTFDIDSTTPLKQGQIIEIIDESLNLKLTGVVVYCLEYERRPGVYNLRGKVRSRRQLPTPSRHD